MIAVVVVAVVALALTVGFAVFALRVQRDALATVVRLAAERSSADADERHTLANRIQRPEVLQVNRTQPPPAPVEARADGYERAGTDVSDLSAEEFERDFMTTTEGA